MDKAQPKMPNIGPRGQWHRLRIGIVALGAGAILAAVLFAFGVPRGWRITLIAPLWVAALGFFQARDKT